jgi:hypothetical protein
MAATTPTTTTKPPTHRHPPGGELCAGAPQGRGHGRCSTPLLRCCQEGAWLRTPCRSSTCCSRPSAYGGLAGWAGRPQQVFQQGGGGGAAPMRWPAAAGLGAGLRAAFVRPWALVALQGAT